MRFIRAFDIMIEWSEVDPLKEWEFKDLSQL